MKKYFCLVLFAITTAGLMSTSAMAQEATDAADLPITTKPTFQVSRVNDENIATLKNLHPGDKLLVYLDASADALQSNAAAWQALQNWIKAGGVLAVNSDAATLFGFVLQPARLGNPRQGGQLFGRAVAASPFGSQPLLWDQPANAVNVAGGNLPELLNSSTGQSSASDPAAFNDVTVYYRLQEGDPLLVSHPTAVPLLRVTDLADPQGQLYASAIASFGNGWVVFVPRQIEIDRGQSGQFWTNLLDLARNPPLPINLSALTSAATSLTGDAANYAVLLAELQDRLSGKVAVPATAEVVAEATDAATATSSAVAGLMPAAFAVSRSTAKAMVAAIKAAQAPAPPENSIKRVNSVIALWMLQAQLQREMIVPGILEGGQTPAPSQWLTLATNLAPNAKEVLFWQGVAATQRAANITLPSRLRAAAFNAAATAWNQAAGAIALLTPASQAATTGTETALAPMSFDYAELASAMLTKWAGEAGQAARITAAEPPLVTVVRGGQAAAVLRHVRDDSTLRLAIPSIRQLLSLTQDLGWVAPEEEILIFPNEATLANYAAQLQSLDSSERPIASSFGRYGRVVGDRILMVSQPSIPIILPGTPPRVLQAGTAAAAIVARLHAELLLNSLTVDGNSFPDWMRLGMMVMCTDTVTTKGDEQQRPSQELLQAGATNQLLGPGDFNVHPQGQSGLPEAEAQSLMNYFYQEFGAGAVMETGQRLGSGETIDEALIATTGMNETEFFSAWYDALVGN